MGNKKLYNNCFSIIFRGEYQGLQNNRLKHRNADVIVRFHTRISVKFSSQAHMYTDCESIYSSSSALKQTSKKFPIINLSFSFVL